MTTSATSNGSERIIAIDRLRTAMMCVVMFGHALLPYLTVPRRFKDPETDIVVDWIGVLLYAFAMQAFFVTAGFAAAALFLRRGSRTFWRNRWLRIGVPLLVGYFVLTPLVRCAERFAQAVVRTGELAEGWAVVASLEWLRWNKLYHLWFLAALILFSALILGLRRGLLRLPAGTLQRADTMLRSVLLHPLCGVALGAVIAVPTMLYYIGGTPQGTDGWLLLALFAFFALGWWLYSNRDVLASFSGRIRGYLLLTVVLLPACVWSTRQRLFEEDTADIPIGMIAGASNAMIAAAVTVLLLGWFQQRFNAPSRIGDYLSAASYWIYLVHYPIVIAAGGLVVVLPTGPAIKYLVAVSIAVPIILGTYHLSGLVSRAIRSGR